MEKSNVWSLFANFNKKYFEGKLDKVRLSWSPNMTLCAGKTAYRVRRSTGASSCSIRLSQPILSQRPHCDTISTLLHEMIHAYLHVTKGLKYGPSHGPEFKMHMKKINAKEGTKITVFHNFKKEVDKFRIHVYKCDGPCVSRRPFFGILRRAIERPPGPTDKWWARHKRECGGTFRKIEGPGAVPANTSASDCTRKIGRGRSKLSSNAVKKSESIVKKSKEVSNTIKMAGKKPVGNMIQKSHVNFSNKRKRQDFDEDAVLKKIRDKYANTKQTVLLSQNEAEQLNSLNSNRYSESTRNHERPFYADGRMKSQATPFGNYVEGNVNYNYQPHSPEIRIAKYLCRYREARMRLDPSESGGSYNSNSFQFKGKSSNSVLKSKEFKSLTDSQMNEDRMPINYNYVSRTPELSISKYIERYRAAVNEAGGSGGSVYSAKHSSKSVKLVNFDKRQSDAKQFNSSCAGTSRTSMCSVCHNQIPAYKYEQHLKTCHASDFDSDIEILDGNQWKSAQSSGSKNFTTSSHRVSERQVDEPPHAKNCPNCGSKVLVAEMKLHLEYCTESDDDLEIIEAPKKLTRDTRKEQQHKVNRPSDADVVSCPSCANLVKKDKLQEHLDECLQFFSEEF